MLPAFHAFTFEGMIFSGPVAGFEEVEGIVQFTYSYAWESEPVNGSFSGERTKDGKVTGTWIERSKNPVRGKTRWQGSGIFQVAEDGGRSVFHGSWKMPGYDERWVVDVATS